MKAGQRDWSMGIFEELARGRESDRFEPKESLSNKDARCETICAFANDLACSRKQGVLVTGLKDDGSCAGAVIDDILPQPSMLVERTTLRAGKHHMNTGINAMAGSAG